MDANTIKYLEGIALAALAGACTYATAHATDLATWGPVIALGLHGIATFLNNWLGNPVGNVIGKWINPKKDQPAEESTK